MPSLHTRTRSPVCHATAVGLWRGAQAGVLASSAYIILGLLYGTVRDIATTQTILQSPLWVAKLVSVTLVLGLAVGVIPALVVGAITGSCLALGLHYLKHQRLWIIGLVSAGVCFLGVVSGHSILWLLYVRMDWDLMLQGVSATTEGRWLAYLAFIGVPSVIYIAIGVWQGMSLSVRQNDKNT